MSDTPFLPDPVPLGFPSPLQPRSGEDASEHALKAMEEDALRRQAREKAFSRIYYRYRPQLLKYARRCLKAAAEVEDLVHDVMLGIWNNDLMGQCGTDERCIESYLMISMKHRVFDEYRARGSERKTLADYALWGLTRLMPPDLASRFAESRDSERFIRKLIDELPPRCRQAFIARRMLDMPAAQVATLLGISVKTVDAQVARAQWLLRRRLQALGYSARDIQS